MKIEKAIEIMKYFKNMKSFINTKEEEKAYDLAIEALEKQMVEDENPPLTLHELKNMVGEPVWTMTIGADTGEWELVGNYIEHVVERDIISMCNLEIGDYDTYADLYGKTWLAYRRKPEGVMKK